MVSPWCSWWIWCEWCLGLQQWGPWEGSLFQHVSISYTIRGLRISSSICFFILFLCEYVTTISDFNELVVIVMVVVVVVMCVCARARTCLFFLFLFFFWGGGRPITFKMQGEILHRNFLVTWNIPPLLSNVVRIREHIKKLSCHEWKNWCNFIILPFSNNESTYKNLWQGTTIIAWVNVHNTHQKGGQTKRGEKPKSGWKMNKPIRGMFLLSPSASVRKSTDIAPCWK